MPGVTDGHDPPASPAKSASDLGAQGGCRTEHNPLNTKPHLISVFAGQNYVRPATLLFLIMHCVFDLASDSHASSYISPNRST